MRTVFLDTMAQVFNVRSSCLMRVSPLQWLWEIRGGRVNEPHES